MANVVLLSSILLTFIIFEHIIAEISIKSQLDIDRSVKK